MEALNNAANGFSIQITAADLPRCTRSYLFALQQAGFNQPLDGVVTDAAYSRSFAQTHSLRIVQSSFLTGNRMVTPGCRYTGPATVRDSAPDHERLEIFAMSTDA